MSATSPSEQPTQSDAGAARPVIDDGGPAFPFDPEACGSTTRGMSLRDYFAGQALAGILAGRQSRLEDWVDGAVRNMSVSAYLIADAMLAAKKDGGAA